MSEVAAEQLQVVMFSPEYRRPVIEARPEIELDQQMMAICLDEARQALESGNPPVGAVLYDFRLDRYWSDHTTDKTDRNGLNHAEIKAYQKAQPYVLDNLGKCALWSTLELCLMCTAVYAQMDISSINVAVSRREGGFQRKRKIQMYQGIKDARITCVTTLGVGKESAQPLFDEYNRLRAGD